METKLETLLLVDHSPSVRDSLFHLFKYEYLVRPVADHEDALEILRSPGQSPSVLVVGYEPESIKATEKLIRTARICLESEVAIIVFSVFGRACEERVIALGADAIVEKPDVLGLRRQLASVLGERRSCVRIKPCLAISHE